MRDILIIHHEADAADAAMLARALGVLGFDAPKAAEAGAICAEPAAAGRCAVAIVLWSRDSREDAGFIAAARAARAGGRLCSVRGPGGQPPAPFDLPVPYPIIDWDGAAYHPHVLALSAALVTRFGVTQNGQEPQAEAPSNTEADEDLFTAALAPKPTPESVQKPAPDPAPAPLAAAPKTPARVRRSARAGPAFAVLTIAAALLGAALGAASALWTHGYASAFLRAAA